MDSSKLQVVETPCPKCGRPTQATVGMLRRGSTLTCDHCGHIIVIDGDLLRSVLDWMARKRDIVGARACDPPAER